MDLGEKMLIILNERIEYLTWRIAQPFNFRGNKEMTEQTLALNQRLLSYLTRRH